MFKIHFRPRRRSGSSILVLGGDDTTLKARLPVDDYLSHIDSQHTNENTESGVNLEMLTMLSVNQDNGKIITIYYYVGNFICCYFVDCVTNVEFKLF